MLIDSIAGLSAPPVESMSGLVGSAAAPEAENSIANRRSKHLTRFSPGAEIFAPGGEVHHIYEVEFGAVAAGRDRSY